MTDDKARAEMAMMIKRVVDNFDPIGMTQLWRVLAIERRIKYEAHLKAGFTEQQALELCKGN